LRVIVAGLIVGVKSVVYIVMLLFLVVYLFAIMGCLLFGANDPARFGTVPMAMLSLFQVRGGWVWVLGLGFVPGLGLGLGFGLGMVDVVVVCTRACVTYKRGLLLKNT